MATPAHGRWSGRLADWSPCALLVLGLAVLKAYGLHLQPGDEGIYFYLAARVAEAGLTPYRDFFFAHPPVHLLVGAGAFKLFGASASVGKAIPAVAAVGTLILVYGACLRRFGRFGAFVSGAVLVCSYDYLRASSHFTGVNVTLLLATAAAVASLGGRAGLGGALAGLAASAGLYALMGITSLIKEQSALEHSFMVFLVLFSFIELYADTARKQYPICQH